MDEKPKKKKKDPNEFGDRERAEYRGIARNFKYPKQVLDLLDNAKSAIQCEQILKSAREKYLS